jgi:DNA-binding response OmpR family regulator
MNTPTRLLVVDDDASVRSLLRDYLEERGFAVAEAANGSQMREEIERAVPDAVLLDVRMPGEDGLLLARFLRERYRLGILMVTASGDVVDRVVGLEVGADDYIAKPFDLRELLARLRAVLRRRAAARGAAAPAAAPAPPPLAERQVRMGRNILCLDSRRLLNAEGFEVPLAASEFELLRSFAERPRRTLTREMLLDLAHAHGEDRFDRSIDVRITRIRRKIEVVPSRPQVIRTVRGIGYVFDPDAEG